MSHVVVFQSMTVDYDRNVYEFRYHAFTATVRIKRYLSALKWHNCDAQNRVSLELSDDDRFIRVFSGNKEILTLEATRD